ncbi:MAG: EAL domain-containing protein [Chloroflexota bacterium]|nr:EAL domain-containing protein [Chloroflexota bacterium]
MTKDSRTVAARLAGRMAAVLLLCGGLGIMATTIALPGIAGMDPGGIMAVVLAALATGATVWFLPWERWHPRATLVLVPVAFLIIALGNHFAAAEPFRYSVAFIVAFCWIGFAHPRGTALAFSPLLAVAYVVPLLTTGAATPQAVASLLFVAPVSVAIGESMAWVAGRMRAAEGDLQRTAREARFRSLVQNASDVIMIVDADYQVSFETPSIERVLGHQPDAHVGTSLLELVHPDDDILVRAAFDSVLAGTARDQALEFRVRHADDSWHPVQGSVTNLMGDDHVRGLVLNFRDISERRQLEHELRHQAFHDALTGLANRWLFVDRLEHAIARLGRAKSSLAVMFIDLDDFKTVNDTLGHETGDEVLRSAADRIRTCLRPADSAARFGGDEFVVLLEDTATQDAFGVAERVLHALGAPHRVRGRELTVRASIGIVVVSNPRQTASEVLRNADVAMYSAKDDGKGRICLFRNTMQRAVARRLKTKSDLELAVERGDFVLRYQPIVELEGGRLHSVEALVRWSHPRRGLLSPAEFIGVAEESGLVVGMGNWVLREAFRQGRAWLDQTSGDAPLPIGLNLSVKQLEQPSFVADLKTLLQETGLPPSLATLEITESVLMRDTRETMKVLAALKRLGVRLVLDQFGTGYSSLNYLSRFPIDGIKIDRSFIAGLDNSEEAAVLSSILNLSRDLGLEAVVEGLERNEQVRRVMALGGTIGQGYYFAEPMSADLLGELLSQKRSIGLLRGDRELEDVA